MYMTALTNGLGALIFMPFATALRRTVGLSVAGHPLYLAIIASFIFIFGLAYLWVGITGRADALFLAVAAAGKLAFFSLVVVYWLSGALPLKVPLAASSDLLFALAFVVWLLQQPNEGDGLA